MHRTLLIASLMALALVPASGRAQGSGDETARRLQATRAELEARRDALREMARTARPDWLVAESTVVQMRLDQGDFRVGDRVVLIVERSEEHTSELQSQSNLVCRLLLEKNNNN